MELLLICRDCDLAFGSDRLDQILANRDALLTKQVREHVHRRRLMLLRCEDSGLKLRQEALERHLTSLSDVRTWVVDLTRLPEMSAAFADGVVMPEDALIAGIPLLSSEGEEVAPARRVEEILAALTAFEAPPAPRASLDAPAIADQEPTLPRMPDVGEHPSLHRMG